MFSQEVTKEIRSIRGALHPSQWKAICQLSLQGGEAYLKAGQKEKAADLFLKGENYQKAAEIYRDLENWEKAFEAYKKGKLFEEAAEMFEKMGRMQESYRMRAEFFRQNSKLKEAAEYFAKGKEFQTAAELWVHLGEIKKAADCYKQAFLYAEAGGLYAQVGDHENAAFCFEKGGSSEEAANHYGKLGNVDKQVQFLLEARKFLEAGKIYIQKGKPDKAIKILQGIGYGESGYRLAASLLGKIFFDKGMLGVALKKFQQGVRKERITNTNLRDYYYMGLIQERQGALKEASTVYEQILVTHYNYEDVADRLGKVQLELSQQNDRSPKSTQIFQTPNPTPHDPGLSPGSPAKTQERFEILGEIGRGGMGVVYKARDRILNREVALKYLPANFSNNSLAVKNFQREAQSTARLNHPGIVIVYDVGFDIRGNYIAMEYLEGVSIKDHIKSKGGMEIGQVLELLKQMTDALAYAHQNKIIHRDIKTSNMMWCKSGAVKLMDFGLAKFISEARNVNTQISGTPYYMSPEQTLGKNLDHRTDIYSLGVSMYEMATGEVPFIKGDIGYHHVNTPPPDPIGKIPLMPIHLRDIIWKCMEKEADKRYLSAEEMGKEIEQVQLQWKNRSGS